MRESKAPQILDCLITFSKAMRERTGGESFWIDLDHAGIDMGL